jgi:hypothetical protein
MVVGFDLEGHSEAIANGDYARILTWTLQYPRRSGGQRLEQVT